MTAHVQALQAARNILVGGAGPAQQAQRELDAIMPLRQREFAIFAEAVESAERRRLGPERRRGGAAVPFLQV